MNIIAIFKKYTPNKEYINIYPKHNRKKKTVFVTGDIGKLGSVISAKIKNKYNIIGFDLQRSKKEDLKNYKELTKKMQGVDYVIHLAAIPHPRPNIPFDKYFNINVVGTLNVLNAAKENDVKKVIYISSTAYYGCDTEGKIDPLYFPIDELHPPASRKGITNGKLAAYGQSKVIAEEVCAYFGTNFPMDVIVLRSGPASENTQQFPSDFDWKKNKDYRRGSFWVNNPTENIANAVNLILKSKTKMPFEVFNVVNSITDEKINIKKFLEKEYPKTKRNQTFDKNESLISNNKIKKLGFISQKELSSKE